MVKFNQNGFSIEVQTEGNPVEAWLETCTQMISILQIDTEGVNSQYHALELLKAMMPESKTALKMSE